jgi:hypothetical protein
MMSFFFRIAGIVGRHRRTGAFVRARHSEGKETAGVSGRLWYPRAAREPDQAINVGVSGVPQPHGREAIETERSSVAGAGMAACALAVTMIEIRYGLL